jgi:hypothetical protein
MWTEAKIKALLETNDKAVMRALVAIYRRQTDEEKQSRETRASNGVGFNAFDAKICTELALQVINGRGLSRGQLSLARNKMKRYHRQLIEVAKEMSSGVRYWNG